MISIWAAVWAPTPKPSKSVGAASVVRRVRCWSCVAFWPYGPDLGGERLRAGLHLWPEIPAQPNGVTNLSG